MHACLVAGTVGGLMERVCARACVHACAVLHACLVAGTVGGLGPSPGPGLDKGGASGVRGLPTPISACFLSFLLSFLIFFPSYCRTSAQTTSSSGSSRCSAWDPRLAVLPGREQWPTLAWEGGGGPTWVPPFPPKP